MSEVIVRMEMPSGCDKCPFCYGICIIDEKDERYGRVHYNEMVVRISGNKYAVRKDRPSWCPIVGELPEQHGELIDMRELLKRKMKMDWSVLEWVHEVDICNARVIVPATERNER